MSSFPSIRRARCPRDCAWGACCLLVLSVFAGPTEAFGQWARGSEGPAITAARNRTDGRLEQPPVFHLAQDGFEDLLEQIDESAKPPAEPEEPENDPDDTQKEPGDADEDRRLGEAPEDTSRLFLRQATVLLAPGEMQFDHGLTYSLTETVRPIFLSDDTLTTERIRSRQWLIPFGFRYGIKKDVQAFMDIPFGYALIERADRELDERDKVFGIGDVSAGLSMVLQHEKDNCPDVIGTFSFSAPTGDDPFGVGATDPALGAGFWGISANVNAVKSYDPVVLFGAVGYSHFFPRSFSGVEYELGETIFYAFGMGMAVNDDITLSSSLIGSFQPDVRVNAARVPRTATESISLRFAVTGTMYKCHIVEPFVRFGLTNDATDVNFGLIVTRL